MKLQYVLGNPSLKSGQKAKKKVPKKRKARKIKLVGGNPVSKRKRLKKGSKAAKAWGRKMAALRAGANPKKRTRKRRKNPYYFQASGEIPVTKKISGRSGKFYSPAELKELLLARLGTEEEIKNLEKRLRDSSPTDLLVSKELGTMKKRVAEIKRLQKADAKEAKHIRDAEKAVNSALNFKDKIEKAGGSVAEVWTNPKKRKSKSKSGTKKRRSAAQRAATKKLVALNKKRRGKKGKNGRGKARKSRKSELASSAKVFKAAKTIKFKRAKRKIRVKMIGVVNPSIRSLIDSAQGLALPAVYAASGYLAINFLVLPLIDKYAGSALPGGSVAGSVAKIPVVGPHLAPYAGSILGAVGGLAVAQVLAPKIRDERISSTLRLAGLGAAGLSITLVVLDALKQYVYPSVAKAAGLAPSTVAGVLYFPMAGADFGMYPQFGDGYKQQPGDWGNQTVGGVEYFPNRSLNGVEYFPDGADGDRSFPQSRAEDYAEAEGLGEIPAGLSGADFGEIPEGMSGADFGEIPTDMG